MDNDKITRNLLKQFLIEPKAHGTFEQAAKDFPVEYINKKVEGVEYSAWQLIEHIRLAYLDIYEFMINPDYVSPKWPEGYWPNSTEEADKKQWENSIAQINGLTGKLVELLDDEATELSFDLPHAKGYNILREIVLVIDHNAYHIGQLVILRKLLGIWN